MHEKYLLYLTGLACLIAACDTVEDRYDTKSLILAKHVSNAQSSIASGPIPTHYQEIRMTPSAISAQIYIEGDGYAYISKSKASSNPTPKTPVALKLAMEDRAQAVFYIARPCQYIPEPHFGNKCRKDLWTTHRYSKEIVQSIETVLDEIKSKHGIQSFNLIGFSGGGNIAGLLAVKRNDVTSLRTVAGNLDNDFFTQYHNVSVMPSSLNMADYARQLSSLPQVHFVSPNDDFVPAPISQSYLSKLGDKNCTQTFTIQNTTHLNGWAAQWPELLQFDPVCN